ncbi:isoprenylcysteine carboxylmethyltransferase family protein [Frankia sp. KB5]|uniref:methyltransferase family protein n=1 Tax=Frankia sp. KB5 TaxID=683318 RepID=UPI000A0F6E38|nr:isoprenylcysteine carboxylmethyltransferase family protein [Frankia sp. KB5]ORT53494.1 hypothetical protein KBI5_06675 [Frankia sp. KB5]
MAAVCVALYLVWLLTAFVLRGAIQYVRTGDHGMRRGVERPFSTAWSARMAFVLALVAGGLSAVLVAGGVLAPVGALDVLPLQVVGLILAVASAVATFVAQLAMGASWRVGVDAGERTELVVRRPFTVVRNPIFTTMGLTALGLACMVPTFLTGAGLVLLVWALEYQVRHVEEPYLLSLHDDPYRRYLAEVGRFVPGIGRVR